MRHQNLPYQHHSSTHLNPWKSGLLTPTCSLDVRFSVKSLLLWQRRQIPKVWATLDAIFWRFHGDGRGVVHDLLCNSAVCNCKDGVEMNRSFPCVVISPFLPRSFPDFNLYSLLTLSEVLDSPLTPRELVFDRSVLSGVWFVVSVAPAAILKWLSQLGLTKAKKGEERHQCSGAKFSHSLKDKTRFCCFGFLNWNRMSEPPAKIAKILMTVRSCRAAKRNRAK